MTKTQKVVLVLSLLGNLTIFYVGFKALEYRNHINYFLDKYTNVVNEFSGRKYFSEENQELSGQINKGKRIVLFGTQVTANWKTENIATEFELINRGVPHQRLAGYLLRFKPDVIDLEPKAVIIEVSSYNFRSQHTIREIMDYVSSMAELAKFKGIEPILTTIIPPKEHIPDSLLYPDGLQGYSIKDSLQFYNNWLRDYASQNSFICADFNKILSDENGYLRYEYSNGAIDLNALGYQKISEIITNLKFKNNALP